MTDLRLDAPEPLLTIQRRTGLADEIRRETAPLLADEAISEPLGQRSHSASRGAHDPFRTPRQVNGFVGPGNDGTDGRSNRVRKHGCRRPFEPG
ncbi:hypothetical protein [Kitasatospora sp. NPDC050543]|uniref:hypothetical protein n=1 Tax=Kitasatospora sp. NPDC050543 TaxID=3364054 RepID=UPI0037ADC4CC